MGVLFYIKKDQSSLMVQVFFKEKDNFFDKIMKIFD